MDVCCEIGIEYSVYSIMVFSIMVFSTGDRAVWGTVRVRCSVRYRVRVRVRVTPSIRG